MDTRQHQEIEGPSRYARVDVISRDGRVFVKPDPVEVFFDDADRPDSVRWYIRLPDGASSVALTWEVGAPFINWRVEGLGASAEAVAKRGYDLILTASGNLREQATFKYTLMFLDEHERVVAWVDPRIKNEPIAPVSTQNG